MRERLLLAAKSIREYVFSGERADRTLQHFSLASPEDVHLCARHVAGRMTSALLPDEKPVVDLLQQLHGNPGPESVVFVHRNPWYHKPILSTYLVWTPEVLSLEKMKPSDYKDWHDAGTAHDSFRKKIDTYGLDTLLHTINPSKYENLDEFIDTIPSRMEVGDEFDVTGSASFMR